MAVTVITEPVANLQSAGSRGLIAMVPCSGLLTVTVNIVCVCPNSVAFDKIKTNPNHVHVLTFFPLVRVYFPGGLHVV